MFANFVRIGIDLYFPRSNLSCTRGCVFVCEEVWSPLDGRNVYLVGSDTDLNIEIAKQLALRLRCVFCELTVSLYFSIYFSQRLKECFFTHIRAAFFLNANRRCARKSMHSFVLSNAYFPTKE